MSSIKVVKKLRRLPSLRPFSRALRGTPRAARLTREYNGHPTDSVVLFSKTSNQFTVIRPDGSVFTESPETMRSAPSVRVNVTLTNIRS